MTCKEIRKTASLRCEENSGRLALLYFLFGLITGLANISFNFGEDSEGIISPIVIAILGFLALVCLAVQLFVVGPMTYGMNNVIKKNYHGVKPNTNDLFFGFKNFWNSVGMYLLILIYTFLWSLLFIIPGIIKGISYSMAYFISLDNQSLSPNECITKSKEMMKGHKCDLFVLQLSYFGWYLLIILTFGILSFWVVPKQMTANYVFYRRLLKDENKNNESIVSEEQESISE